ncbi:hypothetical protein PFLUV_G00091400 [Perca fluviatilis]|uniref:MARVEL domain-containing protein n=1 Tax=Perca fluviatilis TaxID=8168 RepID=A0A6A5F229_PERFL|nr:CKLF-like MARVEL transmembrane domain-containing protein 7 [Perca fluviatilis]KAF1388546.1 hypothetical protein PFLUV_G00091400 [Perca fluviatilis]
MSHTVITTTTTTRTSADGVLNTGYTRTIPGLLKIGQMLALLVAFLCVHCVFGWPNWAAMQFFEVVVLWFLIAFLIFFLMHLFRLQARMPCINWPLTVFGFIATFLMAVSLWTSYSVTCGSHQTGAAV